MRVLTHWWQSWERSTRDFGWGVSSISSKMRGCRLVQERVWDIHVPVQNAEMQREEPCRNVRFLILFHC